MFVADSGGTALLIGAIAGLIVAVGGVLAQVLNFYMQVRGQRVLRSIDAKTDDQTVKLDEAAVAGDKRDVVMADMHEQVTTINGKTAAELLDAGETRRIEEIPVADRTDDEQEHLDKVPPPPGGAS